MYLHITKICIFTMWLINILGILFVSDVFLKKDRLAARKYIKQEDQVALDRSPEKIPHLNQSTMVS